jgi:6-phosphogluconolactonase
VPPGSGPRHFAFHPGGNFGYVLNQLKGTLIGFSWNASRGVLKEIQNIDTVPKSFLGINNAAEVAAHPNGKFLYVSNRGADMMAVLSVDPEKGTAKIVQQEPTRGISPRHFAIDPSGKFLFVAHNYTENVIVFGIDGQTGRIDLLVRGGLQQTAKILKVAAPVCVRFVPVK